MGSPEEEHPDADSDDSASASMTNAAASNLCDLIFFPPKGRAIGRRRLRASRRPIAR